MKDQVKIAIIFVIAVGIIASGVCYFFWNERDDLQRQINALSVAMLNGGNITSQTRLNIAADWNTYTNQKYDFTIKYPNSYSYRENYTNQVDIGSNGNFILVLGNSVDIKSGNTGEMSINIWDSPSNTNDLSQPVGMSVISSKQVQIGNEPTMEYKEQGGRIAYVFNHHGCHYVLSTSKNASESADSVFGLLVYTFQFNS